MSLHETGGGSSRERHTEVNSQHTATMLNERKTNVCIKPNEPNEDIMQYDGESSIRNFAQSDHVFKLT
jgi:hypothetical protein